MAEELLKMLLNRAMSERPKLPEAPADQPWQPYERGNIDLYNRPPVQNPDGSTSTVRSLSFQDEDGREVLIPTVVGDRVVSDEEAIQHYLATQQHLGKFASPDEATRFGARLHNEYAKGKYNKK